MQLYGQTNIASYLIKKGADIDLQDKVSESYIVFDLNYLFIYFYRMEILLLTMLVDMVIEK